MIETLLRPALRPLSRAQIRQIHPVRSNAADPRFAVIHQGLERHFGVLAPPVLLHAPAPDTMAAAWILLYETLLARGRVERSIKEAVASVVSEGNSCPYCARVHTAMFRGLFPGPAAAAITAGHPEAISDPRLRAVAEWTRASAAADTAAGSEIPFPAEQASEIIGVTLTLHYFNRMAHVFLGEAPLPPGVPLWMLRVVGPPISRLMRVAARTPAPPGASLELLPPAPATDDLHWAQANPAIAGAFARAAAAVEAAGAASVPAEVRGLVLKELADWNGHARGLSRGWVEDAVRDLPDAARPAGRLALLIAFASYQVDQGVIDAFRARSPGDAALVELASWSSLAAARRIGRWMRGEGSGNAAPAT